MAKTPKEKKVEALTHEQARRKNIPTAEHQSLVQRQEENAPVGPIRYARVYPLNAGTERSRDKDIDPQIIWNGARIRLTGDQVRQLQEKGEIEIGDAQLVWRGKDQQDWSDLVVNAPPLYIQEKVHPKAIIDDLVKQSKKAKADNDDTPNLFADFNGLDDPGARTEFYQHSQHWSNRMILGDSLQVMASLAEREHLRGQVQCIYFDPPYGIKFNSNWQVSTLSRDVKDGKQTDISREPEQVKAFRDTWKDGIHSYLTYLRDRLTVARDLLHESGSIFVQIGDENVHRVRGLLDEVFGPDNCVSQIAVEKTSGSTEAYLSNVTDSLLWYSKSFDALKYRPFLLRKEVGGVGGDAYGFTQLRDGRRVRSSQLEEPEIGTGRIYRLSDMTSQSMGRAKGEGAASWFPVNIRGRTILPSERVRWKTNEVGMTRLARADRLEPGKNTLNYVRFIDDFPAMPITNLWDDVGSSVGGDKIYVVQTGPKIVERCILMTTDPGDLILDPTCGSGTTATVAEQWGRRWITVDTSRVALALARTRLMSARYPFYYLADTKEGRSKEQEVTGKLQADAVTHADVRLGFVYDRATHITLGSIARNAEIDIIWEEAEKTLAPLRDELNKALGTAWQEWEIPRNAEPTWPEVGRKLHAAWWEARIERQMLIDASIAKAADVEILYDRPYEDKSRLRVAGPFTVESLSPHRVVPADEDMLADEPKAKTGKRRRSKIMATPTDFADMVLEHLRTAGVHQAEKRDTIKFNSLIGWPGEYICAEAHFQEGETQRRAAIFLGPEFGTLSRVDLVAAAREATDARFDVLIACSFNFDAHASELTRLGPLPILKAKMNPDLHMADELKNTGKGNLFVVFGEPDIDIMEQGDDTIVVKVNGIDVFDPNTGQIRSNDVKGIAAWFIDTDYNEESFFVRHAYFLGANDPYKSLKTSLRAEINSEAWETLYRDTSRPFLRPTTGRIAVKVINHFGDEVMKVYQV
ncbi:MAG: site-specific DNA-methyltransferase [Hyphomicrobium sp.]|nr:site-specific DNA-methyltransferase [Hyphomicrobium sp.]